MSETELFLCVSSLSGGLAIWSSAEMCVAGAGNVFVLVLSLCRWPSPFFFLKESVARCRKCSLCGYREPLMRLCVVVEAPWRQIGGLLSLLSFNMVTVLVAALMLVEDVVLVLTETRTTTEFRKSLDWEPKHVHTQQQLACVPWDMYFRMFERKWGRDSFHVVKLPLIM